MNRRFFKNKNSKRITSIIILLSILAITFLVRIPFLNEPLDRDAGLFATIGREIAKGAIHYKDVTDSKPPGIHFIFAVIYKFIDIDFVGVNLLATIWALLTTFFIYLLSNRLFGKKIAFVSSLIFGIFSSSPLIEGSTASPENFMILFIVIMFFIFIKAESHHRLLLYCLSGMLGGIALCFKQAALFDFLSILFFITISSLIASNKNKIKTLFSRLSLFLIGFAILPTILIVYFNTHNALGDFLNSVIFHNLKYINLMGYSTGYLYRFFILNAKFTTGQSILWLGSLAFILTTISIFVKSFKNKENLINNPETLLSIWIIFAFLGVNFGGRFFPHYYAQILPPLSIATAYILVKLFSDKEFFQTINGVFVLVCILASLLYSVFLNYRFYLIFSPEEISIGKYQWEPFIESREIGYYIKERTTEDDFIYVWAEEPEIYFYSKRKASSKYLNNCQFTYFRTFSPYKEEDLINDLEQNKPVYIVIENKHPLILENLTKFNNFVKNRYILEKEFKVIRQGIWGYSLLLYRLKE